MKKIWRLFIILLALPHFSLAKTISWHQKMQTCINCHGEKGTISNPNTPNLAGQNSTYLRKQLTDAKSKNSGREIKEIAAAHLTKDQIHRLAEFYSKLPVVLPSNHFENENGKKIYIMGNLAKGIVACIVCHGPTGSGNPESGFPILAGQHIQYTVNQLQAFKEKKRSNDLNGIMQTITAQMTLKEMEDVAAYIENLH